MFILKYFSAKKFNKATFRTGNCIQPIAQSYPLAMASVLKATKEIQRRKDKGKGKSKDEASAGEVVTTKPRKDKVLLISSRGVTQRMRHLMNDLEALLPHVKKGKW